MQSSRSLPKFENDEIDKFMISVTKKSNSTKESAKKVTKKKLPKIISAKKHAGKVNWGQDALTYQKQKREEWD